MTMTSQFSDNRYRQFFLTLLYFSWQVTRQSLMLISSLVLELWQFSFISDWPEIQKSDIPLCEFSPISGDWGELGIPNLTRMSVINCYWIIQNARVTVFTFSELLRENQQGGWRKGWGRRQTNTEIRVKKHFMSKSI